MFTKSALAVSLAVSFPLTQLAPLARAQNVDRTPITVANFDYGTVAAQLASDKGARKRLEQMGIRDAAGFTSQLGAGIADMIVEKLLQKSDYRVLERKQLAAIQQEQAIGGQAPAGGAPTAPTAAAPTPFVAPARYIVAGSITRLGFEEKYFGGIAGRLTNAIGGMGAKKNITEVKLTARVIDTQSGEIVASVTTDGKSDKGWGVRVGGLGPGGLIGLDIGSRNFRESAIGEATERAVQKVADYLTQEHGRLRN